MRMKINFPKQLLAYDMEGRGYNIKTICWLGGETANWNLGRQSESGTIADISSREGPCGFISVLQEWPPKLSKS